MSEPGDLLRILDGQCLLSIFQSMFVVSALFRSQGQRHFQLMSNRQLMVDWLLNLSFHDCDYMTM